MLKKTPMSSTDKTPPHTKHRLTAVQKSLAEADGLYADKPQIYPRDIKGTFRTLKWAALWILLGIYHIVPWFRWDRGEGVPDQMILMDLSARRGYFFDIVIWPQEIYYITGVLIVAAVGLFFATALFGRVWCGFTCPQTVWTDLYFWVERKIEGDSNKRRKLDNGPLTLEKAFKKISKHTVWILIAFLMSFAWVWFFNDAPTVTQEIFQGTAGGWVYAFIFGLTFTTYLLAGWAREQVCFYMCPWPRFQGAMFDEDSLVVTYEDWRGEPRGSAPKDRNFEGRGHCINCRMCVQVCPTGIDIRDGQQMQCIGCALCIDACNGIMDKMGLPRDLITYDSVANGLARSKGQPAKKRLVRPRTIGYAVLLVAIIATMVVSLATRSRIDVSVLRDRAPLYVTLSDGAIRNGYTFKILNMLDKKESYTLTTKGISGALITAIGVESDGSTAIDLDVKPDSIGTFRVFVKADKAALSGKSTPMEFILTQKESGIEVDHETVFAGPGR